MQPTVMNLPGVDVLFRVSTSLIFVVAGLGHFFRPEQMIEQLEEAALASLVTWIASAATLVTMTGPPLVVGGLALLFGLHTRAAVAVLIAVLVPITAVTHVGSAESVGPLLKNVALLGALVHFFAYGGGRYSVDGLRRERATSAD